MKTTPRINGWAVAGLALGTAVWTVGWFVFLSTFLQQPAVALLFQLLAAAGVLMLSVVGNRRSYLADQNGRSIHGGRAASTIGLLINGLCVLIVLFLATGYLVDSRGLVDYRGFCGYRTEGLLKGPICEFLWAAFLVWDALIFGFGTVAF